MKKKNNNIKFEKEINDFIKWYSNNLSDTPKEESEKFIKNFIEKMAVWYELRYPDYEVTKKFVNNKESEDITSKLFYNNPYIADILKNSVEKIELKWEDFYNYDAFYNSLSSEDKRLIDDPCYPDLLFLYRGRLDHIHVSPDGKVEMYEFGVCSNSLSVSTNEYKNYNIKEFVELLNKKGIKLHDDSEVLRAISSYDKNSIMRQRLLDCVMYRIIMRGDKKIGYRRAFLFAKEFNRDMQLLVNYGIENDDYNLLISISEHLKSIGKEDIVEDKVFQKHLKLTNLY